MKTQTGDYIKELVERLRDLSRELDTCSVEARCATTRWVLRGFAESVGLEAGNLERELERDKRKK